MKTAEEWLNEYAGITADVIKQIQSDAFHAGKLEGLNEAREVILCHKNEYNFPVCEKIESVYESFKNK